MIRDRAKTVTTPTLDFRKREVLEAIIDCYNQTAAPVGSRTIERRYGMGVSAATIRNTMADLEELGYVTQPHPSAGRVPTEIGYRVYVDTLMEAEELSNKEKQLIQERCTSLVGSFEGIIEQTSKFLSEISHYIGFVLTPELHDSILHRLELIPIDGDGENTEHQSKVLAVLLMASGVVKNHIVPVSNDLSDKDIRQINRILNEELVGLSLRHIQQISHDTAHLKVIFDTYPSDSVMAFTRDTFSLNQEIHVYLDGASNFFSQPEFLAVDKMEPLFRLLEQKEQIAGLLSPQHSTQGIQVVIGSENKYEGMEMCSVVHSCYTSRGNVLGTIGVIGPTRMQYSRIVSIVDFTAQVVSQVFEHTL